MALSKEAQTPILLLLLAALVGYAGYTGTVISSVGIEGLQARKAKAAALRDTLATLEAQTDSAKRELAQGTMEDLRRKLEEHRASLALLRRLVPERNEVPNLLDDISTRARIRGVNLSQVVPQPETEGPVPFNTNQYQMQVIGRYDEIGQFLADVASLQRIIVPYDLSVKPADMSSAKALGDTTGALLEASFQVRTYVKSANAGEDASGT